MRKKRVVFGLHVLRVLPEVAGDEQVFFFKGLLPTEHSFHSTHLLILTKLLLIFYCTYKNSKYVIITY